MLQQKNSYTTIGQFIEPVVDLLVSTGKLVLLSFLELQQKELVVSTIGVLYSENDAEENMGPLSEKLKAINPETGQPDFTPLIAISFMVFVLLYLPCIASIVAIVKEAGSWKWGVFSIVYNTSIAWIVSFLVYNIGKLFI